MWLLNMCEQPTNNELLCGYPPAPLGKVGFVQAVFNCQCQLCCVRLFSSTLLLIIVFVCCFHLIVRKLIWLVLFVSYCLYSFLENYDVHFFLFCFPTRFV